MFRHHKIRTGGKGAEKPAQREKGKFGSGPLAVHAPVPVKDIAAVIPENDGTVAANTDKGTCVRTA
jgi:hypothetical protein